MYIYIINIKKCRQVIRIPHILILRSNKSKLLKFHSSIEKINQTQKRQCAMFMSHTRRISSFMSGAGVTNLQLLTCDHRSYKLNL